MKRGQQPIGFCLCLDKGKVFGLAPPIFRSDLIGKAGFVFLAPRLDVTCLPLSLGRLLPVYRIVGQQRLPAQPIRQAGQHRPLALRCLRRQAVPLG